MNLQKQNRKERNRQYFTLLELLIVVAIIAILAGMLLPALHASMQKAKQIQCSGNLKQVIAAQQYYSMDFKDCFVRSVTADNSVKYEAWMHLLAKDSDWKLGNKKIFPGYISSKVFQCPAMDFRSIPSTFSQTYGMLTVWGTGDTFVEKLGGKSAYTCDSDVNLVLFHLQRLKLPSKTMFVVDSLNSETMGGSWIWRRDALVETKSGIALLHGKMANVSFGDGHVASMTATNLHLSDMGISKMKAIDGTTISF